MSFPIIPFLIKLYRCFLQRFHKAFRNAAYSLCLLDLLALLPTAFPSHRYIEDKVLPKYTDYSVVMQRWMGIFLIVAFVFLGYLLSQTLRDCYQDSHAIYTFLSLPCPALALPLAWVTLFFTAVCMLIILQLCLVIVFYPVFLLCRCIDVLHFQAKINAGKVILVSSDPETLPQVFQASRFLQALLPLQLVKVPLWLSNLLLPVSGAAACLCCRRWKGNLFTFTVIIICLKMNYNSIFSDVNHRLICYSSIALFCEILLLLFAFYTIYHRKNLP